jgi:hypothetical protein
LHPGKIFAVRGKREVAVENGLAQLFGKLLHCLGGQRHWEEASQKEMLHSSTDAARQGKALTELMRQVTRRLPFNQQK